MSKLFRFGIYYIIFTLALINTTEHFYRTKPIIYSKFTNCIKSDTSELTNFCEFIAVYMVKYFTTYIFLIHSDGFSGLNA